MKVIYSDSQKYLEWIALNYLTSQKARGACVEATMSMKLAFPELIRVRGLVLVEEPYGLPPTRCPHWWLKTEEGEIIVDPTSHQYSTRILFYEEADESLGPTGRCSNCGRLCYKSNYFCSDECSEENKLIKKRIG